MSPIKVPFVKPWQNQNQLVELLKKRGLVVSNQAWAEEFLSHVSYYRLSGYCLAFEQQRHQFIPGVTFEQIVATYDFDRVLCDLVTEALEVIEIDFRAAVAHRLGETYGAFAHTNPANFFSRFQHADWLAQIRKETDRSNDLFVEHFRNKYSQYPDLPIWMVMEVITFGALSLTYKWMHKPDKRAIAARYGLQPDDLGAIAHHFVYVRNLCAHHARLWDRVWAIKPILPRGQYWQSPHLPSNERLFASLLLQYHLLNRCTGIGNFAAEWRDRVFALMDNVPNTPDALRRMGMTADWKINPLWT